MSKFFILLFLVFAMPISLKASDCQVILETANDSFIDNIEIKEEIRSYLMSHSCYPVLTKNEIQYEIIDVLEESGVVYTFGALSQGETYVLAVFSIDKGWFSTTTQMLYMSTDTPLSPLLFSDVSALAEETALPKNRSNYHVLIEELEDPAPPAGGKLQMWSFYNLVEWIDVIVLTVPTLDGGTDFAIMIPERK